MPPNIDGKTYLQVPEVEDGADRRSLAHLLLVIPGDEETARDADQLAKTDVVDVSSVEELCQKLGVEITGPIEDPDGNVIEVKVPVRNEKTFTVNGLTQECAPILDMYVGYRTYEDVARTLSEDDADQLSEEQVQHLRHVLALLEQADAEEEDR